MRSRPDRTELKCRRLFGERHFFNSNARLLPALARAKDKAQRIKCLGNLKRERVDSTSWDTISNATRLVAG
jgi:hypothetical protein